MLENSQVLSLTHNSIECKPKKKKKNTKAHPHRKENSAIFDFFFIDQNVWAI